MSATQRPPSHIHHQTDDQGRIYQRPSNDDDEIKEALTQDGQPDRHELQIEGPDQALGAALHRASPGVVGPQQGRQRVTTDGPLCVGEHSHQRHGLSRVESRRGSIELDARLSEQNKLQPGHESAHTHVRQDTPAGRAAVLC